MERHFAENAAGIVFFCLNTFLFGHAVLNGTYKILRGALDADNGEYTERYNKSVAVAVGESAVGNARRNSVRYIAARAAA